MIDKAISSGAVHKVPADLRKVLLSDPVARAKWEGITPLARKGWICWAISVKKPETRRQHIERYAVAGPAVLTAETFPDCSSLRVRVSLRGRFALLEWSVADDRWAQSDSLASQFQ